MLQLSLVRQVVTQFKVHYWAAAENNTHKWLLKNEHVLAQITVIWGYIFCDQLLLICLALFFIWYLKPGKMKIAPKSSKIQRKSSNFQVLGTLPKSLLPIVGCEGETVVLGDCGGGGGDCRQAEMAALRDESLGERRAPTVFVPKNWNLSVQLGWLGLSTGRSA